MAVRRADAGGADDAGRIAGQGVDAAAFGAQLRRRGFDHAGIGDRGAGAAAEHQELAVIDGCVAHQDAAAGQQAQRAVGRHDRAIIAYIGGDKGDIATQRADLAEIDDRRERVAGQGLVAAVEEIGIVDVERRGDEAAARLDHAALADNDAVGIDQIDRTGGRQQAVDRRQARPFDAVERSARAVVELDRVALADRKALPVDDRLARALADRRRRAAGRYAGRTGDDLAARGQGLGLCDGGQEAERGGQHGAAHQDLAGVMRTRSGATNGHFLQTLRTTRFFGSERL